MKNNIFSMVINELRAFVLKNYSAPYNICCEIQFSIETLKSLILTKIIIIVFVFRMLRVMLYPQI